MSAQHLSLADVYARLRQHCNRAGGQKAFAEMHGISPQWVSDVLNARKEPGPSILSALGLVKVVTYRPAQSAHGRTRA